MSGNNAHTKRMDGIPIQDSFDSDTAYLKPTVLLPPKGYKCAQRDVVAVMTDLHSYGCLQHVKCLFMSSASGLRLGYTG